MKVLFISPINKYGATQSLLSLCKLLVSEGVDVSAIVPQKGSIQRNLTHSGVKCYWIPFGHNTYNPSKHFLLNIALYMIKKIINSMADIRIWRLIKKEHYDIVHINSAVVDVGSVPAHICHVKLFRHLREFVEEDFGRRFYHKEASYRKIALSDYIIAVSKAICDKYNNNFDSGKIKIIYNGVDESRYLPRRKNILHNPCVKIIMIGQLNAGKGHTEMIKAISMLPQYHSILQVSIVGDGEEMQHLIQLTDQFGLSDNVKFLGYRNDVPEILQNSDICIVASKMEAFGRATVEAMLAGVLVIGACSGGTAEILQSGRGLLYSANSPADLACKISYAINNRKEMQKIAKIAQQYAFENYTASKNADKVKALYLEALSGSGSL